MSAPTPQTRTIYRAGLPFDPFPGPGARRGPALPPWLGRLLLVPLLLALLGLLPAWALLRPPAALAEAWLTGARGPGCLRLVIASDLSGSMTDLQEPRDRAVAQLLGWAPANLRANDEVAVVSFAGDTRTNLAPTPVDRLTDPVPDAPGANSTRLAPLLAAVQAFPDTRCRTALLILGDGVFEDLPGSEADATASLFAAGVDEIALLVPGQTEVSPTWRERYPAAPPRVFDGLNPDATGLAIAEQLARFTGQQLTRHDPTTTH